MGKNLLIAHCIVSCHIPDHLGVANHIDPWFYDVIGLKCCRSVASIVSLLAAMFSSSIFISIKIKQARIASFMLLLYNGESLLAALMEYASVWTRHDKKPTFKPLYHSDDLYLR